MARKLTDEKGELYEHHEFIADPGQTPLRIDKFLQMKLKDFSRNKIQNAIHAGYVTVNDEEVKPNQKIKPGHVVRVFYHKPYKGRSVMPEDIPLDIRYEDDDLMVVHKPPGMVVHPGVGNPNGTLVNALAFYLKDKDIPVKKGNETDRPGLVHRIDKDTSGLLVIAKTDKAMEHLSRQFFDHTTKRNYLALVWGNFDEKQGTIEGNIGRHPNQRMKRTVFPEGEDGKNATTHFKVIEDLYYVTLVECTLETGRTHQIRVHMKYKGHPIFSDKVYGGNAIVKGTVFSKYKQFVDNCFKILPRQALHARSLGFIHPTTGEEMFFEADLPDDFQDCLDKWRKYVTSRKQLT